MISTVIKHYKGLLRIELPLGVITVNPNCVNANGVFDTIRIFNNDNAVLEGSMVNSLIKKPKKLKGKCRICGENTDPARPNSLACNTHLDLYGISHKNVIDYFDGKCPFCSSDKITEDDSRLDQVTYQCEKCDYVLIGDD